jgi:hypothetical protein
MATCACTAVSSRKSSNAADPEGRETDPAAGVAEGEEAAEVEVAKSRATVKEIPTRRRF